MTPVPSEFPRAGDARERMVPLSLKLGALLLVMVGIAGWIVSMEMASRERASLVASKRLAADRAVQLYATYTAPALEFADEETIGEDALALQRSPDFLSVTTFDAAGTRVAAHGDRATSVRFPGMVDRVANGGEDLTVTRRILGIAGEPLGVAVARVSLERENLAFQAARTRIVRAVLVGAVLLVLALALALRLLVTKPLATLVDATRRVRRGERMQFTSTSRDEVGQLGRAFGVMATTIADREAMLREAKQRMQNVLDHMGQAILVFDASGTVEPERSREAAALLGATERSIADVLFPESTGGFIEREAFDAWSNAVFGADRARFEELVDLAPAETLVPTERGTRTYSLAFRPVGDTAIVERIMLVATDVTDERSLRAAALKKDLEYEKRVASMRRLVAGGGQVFVRFLDGARFRIATSMKRLEEVDADHREPVAEIFRHVHTLRGEARCFDLDTVEEQLAAVEFDLSDLRVRRDERYALDERVHAIRERLAACRQEIDRAEALFVSQSPVGASILDQVTVRRSDVDALADLARDKGAEVASIARRLASRPFGESVFVVTESVPRWLSRANKEAQLAVEGRDVPVPPELSRLLPGVLSHLVRNAIAHGLEGPDERIRAGKPPVGTITLGAEASPSGARIFVRDDGRGFDLDALRMKAGPGIRHDSGELDQLLRAGVSSREHADDLAGHGVGIDSVRDELRTVAYRPRIESKPGDGSLIVLEPLPS